MQISLEDFLIHKESFTIRYKCGPTWVLWWKLANENLKLGMPSVGEEVITLVNGHGGNGGDRRVITKIDDRYIYLGRDDERSSLCEKDTWYRDIVRADHKTEIDLSPYRNKLTFLIHAIVS
jgi:hypothetical protein